MNDASLRQRALALFEDIVDLPAGERSARLAALETGEPLLHADVAALLAADAVSGGLLERSPAGVFDAGDGVDEDEATDPLLGQRIGPWHITGIVGRGGMGAVYRGERVDGQFQQQAAIKLIRLGMDRAEVRRRFLRERQLLARLQHPNIATLLDGGVADNSAPYFAMELVDGVSIDRWCDAQQLDLRARIRLFVQVCSAVQHAHQNLAVHRDLKPNNILVTSDGQAKLLDFGIAKLLVDDTGETQTRDHLLTPEYAAPEQLHGEAVSTVTDLYALGVVLYGLLAGAHPYALTSRTPLPRQLALMEREPEAITHAAARIDPVHAHARRLSPRALAAALRGDLAAIVHRCLQAEPARRYPSAEALASDLKAWLDGLPVGARRGHSGYRLRKFVARHRWGVAAGVAALLAIGAALGTALLQAREARLQASEARLQAERAAQTRDFVVTLFESADPMKTMRGIETSAADLLRAAALRVDRELGDAPRVQGEIRAALGSSLFHLGQMGDATALLERSVAQLQALPDAAPALANALQKRAMARHAYGNLDAAEQDLQTALQLLDGTAGDNPLLRIKLHGHLATLAGARGQPRKSLALYRQVLQERQALLGADDPALILDLTNVGGLSLGQDRFGEAVQAYQRASELAARHYGSDDPRMISPQVGLGVAYGGLGKMQQSDAAFALATKVHGQGGGTAESMIWMLHSALGRNHLLQGRYPAAEQDFRRSWVITRTAPGHPNAASDEGLLGLVQLQLQDRSPEAEAHLASATERLARHYPNDHPLRCQLEGAHGLALARIGQRVEGERKLRAALAGLQAAGYRRSLYYARSAGFLADLLAEADAPLEARAWRMRSQQAYVQVLGREHPRSRLEMRRMSVDG